MPKAGEVELTGPTLETVRAKAAAGCFMCRHVLEALDGSNCLRNWPLGDGDPEFPVEAQRYHVLREIGR